MRGRAPLAGLLMACLAMGCFPPKLNDSLAIAKRVDPRDFAEIFDADPLHWRSACSSDGRYVALTNGLYAAILSTDGRARRGVRVLAGQAVAVGADHAGAFVDVVAEGASYVERVRGDFAAESSTYAGIVQVNVRGMALSPDVGSLAAVAHSGQSFVLRADRPPLEMPGDGFEFESRPVWVESTAAFATPRHVVAFDLAGSGQILSWRPSDPSLGVHLIHARSTSIIAQVLGASGGYFVELDRATLEPMRTSPEDTRSGLLREIWSDPSGFQAFGIDGQVLILDLARFDWSRTFYVSGRVLCVKDGLTGEPMFLVDDGNLHPRWRPPDGASLIERSGLGRGG